MPETDARTLGIFAPVVLRRLPAIFLAAAVLLGGVVLLLYYQDRSNEAALFEQAGTHLVELHKDIISRELQSVESDLLYLANQAVLRDFLSGRATTRQELQSEYILFCRQKGVYDQIRYLDMAGHEAIRVNDNNGRPEAVPDRELQAKAGRYYFAQALPLERGEVFISPFDLNVEHEEIERPLKPTIRFATPVFDRAGTKRGVLVLNYLGAVLIRKLSAVSVNFPGSAMLLNRAGYFLHGPSPDDEWAFMTGLDRGDRTLATYYPEEWEWIAGLARGRFQTRHGLFTFLTMAPGPGRPGARPSSGPVPPDPGDAHEVGMVVVSFVPHDVIYARSGLILERILLVYGVALILVLVLGWYLAYAGALRSRHERRIAESETRLRKLSTQLITAQEDERRRLARDLHDELGQLATAITLDLQRAAAQGDDAKKDGLIARAVHGAECLLERLHETVARIRPTLLDDLGLKDAVQNLLWDYQQQTGIVPRADVYFERRDLPPPVSENVYRILQEALTNVARYARVQEVSVVLRAEADQVTLVVRDGGAGFDPEVVNGKGLGILGMRERAELLDGTFAVRSAPGKGTEVEVSVPIREG